MRRLTILVVFVAFTFSCGGQWAVLQIVAWTNMIREYSEMVPFTRAVEMTFSGQYPCELCKAIAEKKKSETAKMLALHKQDKQAGPPAVVATATPTETSPRYFLSRGPFLQTRSEAPPTPPPRLA